MSKRLPLPIFTSSKRKNLKKMPLVQREKERKRVQKVTKKIIVIGVLFLLAITTWHSITFVKFIVSFLNPNDSNRVVAEGRTNIIVDHGDISVVSIDRINNTAHIITLPPNLYVTVPKIGGTYRVSAVYEVGELNGQGQGGYTLMRTAQDIFAVPINGYVKVQDSSGTKDMVPLAAKKKFSSVVFLFKFFHTRNFSETAHTNLSARDIFSLWSAARKIRDDKLSYYKADNSGEFKQSQLADGSKVLSVSDALLDSIIADSLKDPLVAKENAQVKIINASGASGAGGVLSRLVTNIGAQVVRVETAEELQNESKLLVTNKEASQHLVKKLLGLGSFDIIESALAEDVLADVTVILGTE